MRSTDLDERYRELNVQRQLLVIDGKVHLGSPKSAAGVRTLALDEFTNQLLRQQKRAQKRRLAGTGRNPHGYLFTHPDGRPIRPDWLTHRFHALVRKLGVRAGNVDGNMVSSDRRGGSHLYRTYGSRGSRHRNAAR